MNFYIRYFDDETLVTTEDEVIAFLAGIQEINMNADMENDIRSYLRSNVGFPKRYKVRARTYFIIIKTEAATMKDFKDKKAVRSKVSEQHKVEESTTQFGWYEGEIKFKKISESPTTGKCTISDVCFIARCKCASPADCHAMIVNHLTQRVDSRTQFPSHKGKNFKWQYLGAAK